MSWPPRVIRAPLDAVVPQAWGPASDPDSDFHAKAQRLKGAKKNKFMHFCVFALLESLLCNLSPLARQIPGRISDPQY